jgi:hypothetical protein
MKFGSSFCRVTGVSSLNLARRFLSWRAFFLWGGLLPESVMTDERDSWSNRQKIPGFAGMTGVRL